MTFYKCAHCGNIIAYIHDAGVREELEPVTDDVRRDAEFFLVDILPSRVVRFHGEVIGDAGAVALDELDVADADQVDAAMRRAGGCGAECNLKPVELGVADFYGGRGATAEKRD